MKNIFKIIIVIYFFTSAILHATQEHNPNIKHKQKLLLENGYKAILSSNTSFIVGENTLNIIITKNNSFVKNADVNIIFALPTIPNMEFIEHAKEEKEKYSLTANFKEIGEWEYELMFKTSYGTIYSQEGRVTIN